MNNKIRLVILYLACLLTVLIYKKLVQVEPWAIGMSQVISLWFFLTCGLVAALRWKWVKDTVKRFFTEVESPVNLAIFRIVFFCYLFIQPYDSQIVNFSTLPKDLQFAPMGMGWLLPHLPINPSLASSAFLVCKIACFMSMIGWMTRLSTIVAAVTGFYVLGIPQFYGNVSHSHHIFWFMVIFAASRCADAISIDAIFKGFKKADRNESAGIPGASIAYTLPLRFFWLLIGICYFFPGFWKLWNSGTEWILGNNMVNHMYYDWMGFDHWLPPIRIDQWPWLCKMSGAYVIFFEMAFIFFLFTPVTRYINIFMGLSFHNATLLLLNIDFFELQICYVSFLRWDRIFSWIGMKIFTNSLVVLYDGSCSFCRRAIAFLQVFDVFGRIEYKDLHSIEAQTVRDQYKLSEADLMHDMHAVSGLQVVKGFTAYRHIVSRVPFLWPILPFLFLAPVQWLGNTIYRNVADHRSCRLPPKGVFVQQRKQSNTVLIIVGIIMILGSFYYGCIGKGSGWPFACYPTFSEIAWDRFRTIECLVVNNDGTEKTIQVQSLKSKLPPYKLVGLISKIFSLKDEQVRKKKFMALWEVFKSMDTELTKARTVRFYFCEHYTIPEKWHMNPVSRTLAYQFDVN